MNVEESERWKIAPCANCGHGFEAHFDAPEYPCYVHDCDCKAYERKVTDDR